MPDASLSVQISKPISFGTCREGAFCIDGRESPDTEGKGYAETEKPGSANQAMQADPDEPVASNVNDTGSPQPDKKQKTEGTLYGVGPPRSEKVELGVLLTTSDNRTVVEAPSIELFGQRQRKIGDHDTWGAVLGGHGKCENTPSCAIWDVAATTARMKVDAELLEGRNKKTVIRR